MTKLLEQIKADCLEARKAKNSVKALLLTTVVSDVEMKGKNEKREATDEGVISVLKKFLKGIGEVLAVKAGDETATTEKGILEGYLPKAPSAEELEARINEIVSHGANTVGWVMKDLKFVYGSALDGKMASLIINKRLNNGKPN